MQPLNPLYQGTLKSQMNKFDRLFGENEPTNKELVEFLVYTNDLMYKGDVDEMSRILGLLGPRTNKLMMIATLRGLFSYRRFEGLPAWDKAFADIQAYLMNRGENQDGVSRSNRFC